MIIVVPEERTFAIERFLSVKVMIRVSISVLIGKDVCCGFSDGKIGLSD